MSPSRLRHALAAAAAAGLIAITGCSTDDAVKKDAKQAGKKAEKGVKDVDGK